MLAWTREALARCLELRKASSLFDYSYDDISVVGYEHHPALRAPVAV